MNLNYFFSRKIPRKGYEFLGWYTSPLMGEGNKVETIDISNPSTYFAHWSVENYQIRYRSETSFPAFENNPENPLSYNIDTTVSLKVPKQGTLFFSGWKDENDSTANEVIEYILPKGSSGDKSFVAIFSDKIKVTIHDVLVNGDDQY